jgi:hypothetical protein
MRSESIKELTTSLAKAQGEMGHASKDSQNPHFRSKYADLASVWDAIRAPFARNGLAVIQTPAFGEGVVTVTTILSHVSGEWVESTLSVPLAKADAQGIGSAITYARRYALAAVAGVSPAEDDGEAAVGRANGNGHHAPQARPADAPPLRAERDDKGAASKPSMPKIDRAIALIASASDAAHLASIRSKLRTEQWTQEEAADLKKAFEAKTSQFPADPRPGEP